MTKPVIPHRDPELVQREADRKWNGDTEQVATTSFDIVRVDGVQIMSYHKKAHELEVMRDALWLMPGYWRNRIVEMLCCSSPPAYLVAINDWNACDALSVGNFLEDAFCELPVKGHHGIRVLEESVWGKNIPDQHSIDIPAHWVADETPLAPPDTSA
jgi:hypothetical protein